MYACMHVSKLCWLGTERWAIMNAIIRRTVVILGRIVNADS